MVRGQLRLPATIAVTALRTASATTTVFIIPAMSITVISMLVIVIIVAIVAVMLLAPATTASRRGNAVAVQRNRGVECHGPAVHDR